MIQNEKTFRRFRSKSFRFAKQLLGIDDSTPRNPNSLADSQSSMLCSNFQFTNYRRLKKKKVPEISAPTGASTRNTTPVRNIVTPLSTSCLVNSDSYQVGKESNFFVKNTKPMTGINNKRLGMTSSDRNLASMKTSSHQNINFSYEDVNETNIDEELYPFNRQRSWNSYRVCNVNMEPQNLNYSTRRERSRNQDILNDLRMSKPKRSMTLMSADRLSLKNDSQLLYKTSNSQNDENNFISHGSFKDRQSSNSMEFSKQIPMSNRNPNVVDYPNSSGNNMTNNNSFYDDVISGRNPSKTISFPSFPFFNISQELLNKSEILKTNKFYGYELLEWISDSFSPSNSYLAMHFCNCLLVLDLVRHSSWDKNQAMSNTINMIDANRSRTSSPVLKHQMIPFNQDDLYEWTHKIISNSMDRRLEAFENNFQFRLDNKIQEYELQIFKLKNDNVMATCELQSQIEVLIKEVEKYQVLANINNLNRLSWMSTAVPINNNNININNNNLSSQNPYNYSVVNEKKFFFNPDVQDSNYPKGNNSFSRVSVNDKRAQSQPAGAKRSPEDAKVGFLKTLEDFKNHNIMEELQNPVKLEIPKEMEEVVTKEKKAIGQETIGDMTTF